MHRLGIADCWVYGTECNLVPDITKLYGATSLCTTIREKIVLSIWVVKTTHFIRMVTWNCAYSPGVRTLIGCCCAQLVVRTAKPVIVDSPEVSIAIGTALITGSVHIIERGFIGLIRGVCV